MKKDSIPQSARATTALALVLALGACAGGDGPLSNMFGGDKPAENVQSTIPRPDPDSRGVITYQNYQVMVAREGDTIPAMAQRVGLSPDAIARHNGLPVTYTPRRGEVLALPENVGGTPATASSPLWSTEIAASAINSAPLGATPGGQSAGTATTTAGGPNPFANGQQGTVIDPIRHRVEPGETAYSIARLYGVSVTALASWNGLDNQMSLRPNQELLIPVMNGANSVRPAQGTQVAAMNPPGSASALSAPPSASTPLPPNQDVAAATPPPSPNLSQQQPAPAAASTTQQQAAAPSNGAGQVTAMRMPVAGARVLKGFSTSGSERNEGIDLAAPAGTPVVAAADGEVALISRSVGGLGTILLIRHADGLMTVYGRISDVSLNKGDRVTAGQRVGSIAPGDTPNLHFEVRKGTTAVDPAPYLRM